MTNRWHCPDQTRRLMLIVALGSLVAAGGCQVAPYEVANVEVDQAGSFAANLALAGEVVRYDPRYLLSGVPAYDETMRKDITWGAATDTTEGRRAVIWFRFNYANGLLQVRRGDLKSQLKARFRAVCEDHLRAEPTARALAPRGSAWIEAGFAGRGPELYDDCALAIRATIIPEEWRRMWADSIEELGPPREIAFAFAQHYEPWGSEPESFALYYRLTFQDGRERLMRVSMIPAADTWQVGGLQIYRQDTGGTKS